MAGHRNQLEENVIEDNGQKGEVAGIRVRGETKGLFLKNNIIRDNRPADSRRQVVGIQIEEKAGPLDLQSNSIDASIQIKDQRKAKP